ncbi:MAG: hypothetical protein JSV09_16445 [Thermoplasmata archaeon]|nr:MAG: hypothetical protein JSV09_16445 [Thermoplasmata archaeon]
MPKGPKKGKQKEKVEKKGKEETEVVEEEIQKTSIQISTKVRDRLWRLKFRKTYDEFLGELCDMYEKAEEEE